LSKTKGDQKMKRIGLLFCIVALIPQSVFAAPFCAVFSFGEQCYYYTYEACVKAAGTQGACVINQKEAKPPSPGGAPFCVVTSYGTQCWYYDAQSCRQAAASSGGVCAINPNR
jgi:hypothetical protein